MRCRCKIGHSLWIAAVSLWSAGGYSQVVEPYDAGPKLVQDYSPSGTVTPRAVLTPNPTSAPDIVIEAIPSYFSAVKSRAEPTPIPTVVPTPTPAPNFLCKSGLNFPIDCGFGGTYFIGIDVSNVYTIEYVRIKNEQKDGSPFTAADCNASSIDVQDVDPVVVYPNGPPAGTTAAAVSLQIFNGSGSANIHLDAFCSTP